MGLRVPLSPAPSGAFYFRDLDCKLGLPAKSPIMASFLGPEAAPDYLCFEGRDVALRRGEKWKKYICVQWQRLPMVSTTK